MTTPSKNTNAFTLVELLVVITIIALLAGIALPVFGKIQEKARALQDGNNLRQLGVATIAFASDNDGDLLVTTGANAGNWAKVLRDGQLKSTEIFHSPFDKRDKNGSLTSDEAPVSYGMNTALDPSADATARNMDDVMYPSQLVLFAPKMSNVMTFNGTFQSAPTVDAASNKFGSDDKKGGTHNGNTRLKVVFVDGHVEDMTMVQFHNVQGDANTKLRRWSWVDPDQSGN